MKPNAGSGRKASLASLHDKPLQNLNLWMTQTVTRQEKAELDFTEALLSDSESITYIG